MFHHYNSNNLHTILNSITISIWQKPIDSQKNQLFIVINFAKNSNNKKIGKQFHNQNDNNVLNTQHRRAHAYQLSKNLWIFLYTMLQSFDLSNKWSTRCLPWKEHERDIPIYMRIFNRCALFVVSVIKVDWWFNAVCVLNKTVFSIKCY